MNWVHWLIPGHHAEAKSLFESNVASIRMRAGLVARDVTSLGKKFSAGDQISPEAKVIVIGKIGADCANGRSLHWLEQIKRARLAQQKVILDYTDHHLGNATSNMKDFYREALPFVDMAVVSSEKMFHQLRIFFKGRIEIIPDPIEVQLKPTHVAPPNGIPTLLWFGHSTNIIYLVNYLRDHTLCDSDINLFVLTNEAGAQIFSSQPIQTKGKIQVQLGLWSLSNTMTAANLCQACLIPSNFDDPAKSGASSNRLITAFALGLPTLAEKLDSYAPYADFFCDIRSVSLSSFLRQLDLEAKKVERAQKDVIPKYMPESLLKKWHSALCSAR